MEWLGLVIWLVVVACALPLAAAGAFTAPSLGAQSLFVLGGLVSCVLYIVLGSGEWLAWVSVGLALLAGLTVAMGAARLIADERPGGGGRAGDEANAALLAGVELPFVLTAAFVMLLAAAGVTTID